MLPIELSLKGARWTEGVDELEGELLERQALDEAKALAVEAGIRKVIQELESRIDDLSSS